MTSQRFVQALALALLFSPSFATADSHSEVAAQGRIILYASSKAAWPNGSYMCALPTDRAWIHDLHKSSARGIFGRRCKGNKARHMGIIGPMSAGTIVQIFNNRNASTTKPGDSSYAIFQLRQDLRSGQALIVGSFEGSQSNALFGVRSYCNMKNDGRRYCPFRGGNFLDGKVSYIRVLPPRSAERAEFHSDNVEEGAKKPDFEEFSVPE